MRTTGSVIAEHDFSKIVFVYTCIFTYKLIKQIKRIKIWNTSLNQPFVMI